MLAPLQRPQAFDRTLRSLAADRDRGSLLLALAAAALVVCWTVWLVAARVPVYVGTGDARLQVEGEAQTLAAPVAGVLREVRAAAGEPVERGEVLYRLDGRVEERQTAGVARRFEGLERQIEAARAERASVLAALRQIEELIASRLAEAQARAEGARTAAENAEREAERAERLRSEQLISPSEVDRLRSAAAGRAAEAEAAARALDRLRAEAAAERQERRTELAEIDGTISRLSAERATAGEERAARSAEADRFVVRAPFSGRLGDVDVRQAGVVVAAGQPLATLVPDDELRAVAFFPPGEALGRIRPGQSAELRLEAFPWTEYGSVTARVIAVEEATVGERVRVDLVLVDDGGFAGRLDHGLRANALVEVERRSPLRLLVRGLGSLGDAAPTPVAGE